MDKHNSISKFTKLRDDYDKFMEDKQYNKDNFQDEQLMSKEEQEFYKHGNSKYDFRNFTYKYQNDNLGNFGNLNEYQRHESINNYKYGVPINNYTFNIHKNISSKSITALDFDKHKNISSNSTTSLDFNKHNISSNSTTALDFDKHKNIMSSLSSKYIDDVNIDVGGFVNYSFGKVGDKSTEWYNEFTENLENFDQKFNYQLESLNSESYKSKSISNTSNNNYSDRENNENISYKYEKQLYELEKYANGFQSDNVLPEKYVFNELVNNYKHIREKLFGNNLSLEQQNFEILRQIYSNILNGLGGMRMGETETAIIIEKYINDLTLLITLDNQNSKMINMLNDFDLNLFSDLNINKSSEFNRFDNKYHYLYILLSRRYCLTNSKYNRAVYDFIKKNGIKNNVKDLISKFIVRNQNLNIKYNHISKIKHVINPFDNKKYISFLISDKHIELLPYMTLINDNDMTSYINNFKFKQIPDEIDENEYIKFEHMNNLKRLENIKNKLDKEDIDIINSYPNNTYYYDYKKDVKNNFHKVNFKPLIYMALKRDSSFLTKYHENIETSSIDVLEKYVKSINESDRNLLEYLSSENKSLSKKLTKAIMDKNINRALTIASYIKDNKMSYIKNKKAMKELKEYVINKLKDDNWNEKELYIKFVKILKNLNENKATL